MSSPGPSQAGSTPAWETHWWHPLLAAPTEFWTHSQLLLGLFNFTLNLWFVKNYRDLHSTSEKLQISEPINCQDARSSCLATAGESRESCEICPQSLLKQLMLFCYLGCSMGYASSCPSYGVVNTCTGQLKAADGTNIWGGVWGNGRQG